VCGSSRFDRLGGAWVDAAAGRGCGTLKVFKNRADPVDFARSQVSTVFALRGGPSGVDPMDRL
jgi:hypothetical protein